MPLLVDSSRKGFSLSSRRELENSWLMVIVKIIAISDVGGHFYISPFFSLLVANREMVCCATCIPFTGAGVANVFAIYIELVNLFKGGNSHILWVLCKRRRVTDCVLLMLLRDLRLIVRPSLRAGLI